MNKLKKILEKASRWTKLCIYCKLVEYATYVTRDVHEGPLWPHKMWHTIKGDKLKKIVFSNVNGRKKIENIQTAPQEAGSVQILPYSNCKGKKIWALCSEKI